MDNPIEAAVLAGIDAEVERKRREGESMWIERDGENVEACPKCGTPFEARQKWNSGNPAVFMLPICDGDERRYEAMNERLIEGIRRRQP